MNDLINLHNELKTFILKTFEDVQNLKVKIDLKEGEELVTNIDLYVEKEIIGFINKKYPKDKIISEEFYPTNIKENRFWTIDPIDGTSNFANGLDLYCVQIALIENKEVIYSFIYIPENKFIFHAFSGHGAFLNDKMIKKPLIENLSNKLFSIVGFSNKKKANENYNKAINFAKNNNMKIRMLGSAGIELAYIALGNFAILYSDVNNLWDIAPGYLLLKETGCVIKNHLNLDYKLGDSEIIVYNNEKLAEFVKNLYK